MSNYYKYKNAEGEQLNIHYVTTQNDVMYAISTNGKPILWDELIKNYQPMFKDESPPMVTDGMPISNILDPIHIPCCTIHAVEGMECKLDEISGKLEGDNFTKRRNLLYNCIHPLIEQLRILKK